ncbi:sh3 domain-containing [Trichoderma cornu-damae]|uniref:Sh3 domain-containing n=1 Tax=Trichoderma cornu-damae TaxID=654480 RepID=A0A9P8TW27_9HYPO|nr:sh3 domain-containing [Trichoderma cornu-damae]
MLITCTRRLKLNETFQETARVFTSKPVQRAVVNGVLLVSGAVTLLCLAAVASVLFFQNFVPDQFVTTPVHLQYGEPHGVIANLYLSRLSSNPYGVAALAVPMLKSQQDYDISVTLSMPPSPPNVERGNFMVSLYLLDSKNSDALAVSAREFANGQADFGQSSVRFTSRRTALLPYVDPVVSLASRVLFLLYHLIVPTAQTCVMKIPVAERVIFPTDSAIPSWAYVEVEAGQGIQIYSASLTMTAQLSGLRWLMFHHRLLTFITFTMLFWACELAFMSVAWAVFSSLMGSSSGRLEPKAPRGQRRSTTEGPTDSGGLDESDDGDDAGDYPQQFPTYGKHPALKREPDVKDEEERKQPLHEIPVAGEEADDEGEDVEEKSPRDSGVGTSYSGEGSSSVRQRTSRSRLE